MKSFSAKLLAASEAEGLSADELRAWMRRAALRLEDLSPTGRAVEIEAELIDRLDSLAESSGIEPGLSINAIIRDWLIGHGYLPVHDLDEDTETAGSA